MRASLRIPTSARGSRVAFTPFLDDRRICLTNNAAERAVRCIPLGRKAWLFCGSDRGGQRAAIIYTLIQSAKLNDVDPQAWLADVLARIARWPHEQARRAAAMELGHSKRRRSSIKSDLPARLTGWIPRGQAGTTGSGSAASSSECSIA